MSQLNQIKQILHREGKIDNYRCMDTKLTNRLAARINDLKHKGWEFRTEELPNKNCVYHVTKDPTAPVKSEYVSVPVPTLF